MDRFWWFSVNMNAVFYPPKKCNPEAAPNTLYTDPSECPLREKRTSVDAAVVGFCRIPAMAEISLESLLLKWNIQQVLFYPKATGFSSNLRRVS